MTDMTIDKMNFAGPSIWRSDFQDRSRTAHALQGDEVPEVEIAQRSARITRAGFSPRAQKRLDGRAKIGQLERLLDKLNRIRSVAFERELRRRARSEERRVGKECRSR